METMTNVQGILLGKSEGKKLLRRQRHRWEDNIRVDVKK
jgi:hypothetical protein